MLFNSFDFLIFFPIVALGYYLIPHKIRHVWLLVASYYFYMCWNASYALLILFSTAITYGCGLLLGKVEIRWKKIIIFLCIAINIGILVYYKYANFMIDSLNTVFGGLNLQFEIAAFDVLLPVGISFYTFQALGYILDVYRGEVQAEHNFLKYALFVSFFPQLVAGPIERSKDLLSQFKEKHSFSFEQVRDGLMLMLWGYFLKMVLGDRIAVIVDEVYANHTTLSGWYLIVATALFAIQIYCDFGGYSTIAMGAARVMGFRLTDNFECPYMAQSVAEFWRRWHVTLSTWFRDYVYIPLGGNRKGKARKYINCMIVFALSGLWHGAEWSFVVWGLLNGAYQVVGDMLKPLRDKAVQWFGLNRSVLSHKIYRTVATFILIDFAWLFFRAGTMSEAIQIVDSMLHADNIHILFDDSLYRLGLDWKNYMVMLLSIGVLLVVDGLKYYGICIRKVICEQELWFRWLVCIASVVIIVVFGMWGSGYDEKAFIYFQF